MAFMDDSKAAGSSIEILNHFGKREITHIIHDIDGTHSLIREWQPVMSASMNWAMYCGLEDNFDSDENLEKQIARVGKQALPETDKYCIECAGFSALTQMEYAVRRAVEMGNIPDKVKQKLQLTDENKANNSAIIKRIWGGEEVFDDVDEPQAFHEYLIDVGTRLFYFYEKILNGACRDKNTEDARTNPGRWRVPGSIEFMQHLKDLGCVNYFVTGAVVYEDGGMKEEVEACGYNIGPGKIIESLRGSSWDKKMPKDDWILAIIEEEGLDAEKVLVVGDGRTEIKVGVQMNGVTISRLPTNETRQREIHTKLGTNMIVTDYTDPALLDMFYN